MYTFDIITVGALKDKPYREICAEYEKRLGAYCRLVKREIPVKKLSSEPSRSEIESALASEGKLILRALPKGAYLVALCVEGKRFDSPALAEKLRAAADAAGEVAFVIGSSYGLSDEVKRAADLCLSVSDLTFPHGMMQPILYEIIYRSFTIIAGGKYHK